MDVTRAPALAHFPVRQYPASSMRREFMLRLRASILSHVSLVQWEAIREDAEAISLELGLLTETELSGPAPETPADPLSKPGQ